MVFSLDCVLPCDKASAMLLQLQPRKTTGVLGSVESAQQSQVSVSYYSQVFQ